MRCREALRRSASSASAPAGRVSAGTAPWRARRLSADGGEGALHERLVSSVRPTDSCEPTTMKTPVLIRIEVHSSTRAAHPSRVSSRPTHRLADRLSNEDEPRRRLRARRARRVPSRLRVRPNPLSPKSTASRVSRRRAVSVTAGAPMKTVDEAKELFDRQGYKMLDIRPFKAYDREHLTKPPSAPSTAPSPTATILRARRQVRKHGLASRRQASRRRFRRRHRPGCRRRPLRRRLRGRRGRRGRLQRLAQSLYHVREGCASGRRSAPAPAASLYKSGLTLDPNVAAAYEENWGKEPPKHGERGESLAERTKGDALAAEPALSHPPPRKPSRPSRWTRRSTGSARRRAQRARPRGRARRSRTARRGSAWDTFYDENNRPYYHNRETGGDDARSPTSVNTSSGGRCGGSEVR